MADLIAQGTKPEFRWRRNLPQDELIVLGRGGAGWAVPWDEHISRRHVRLRFADDRLKVTRLEGTANPVFFRGQESDSFSVAPGEHFVIGQTSFTLAVERVYVTQDVPRPAAERSFNREFLQHVRYRDADQRILVLAQMPDVISAAVSDADLFVRLINILLAGIRRASTAAIVQASPKPGGKPAEGATGSARVLHWDRRLLTGRDFQPSMRLIRRAVDSEETVLHVWNQPLQQPTGSPQSASEPRQGPEQPEPAEKPAAEAGRQPSQPEGANGQHKIVRHDPVTMDREGDWAFVTPLSAPSCEGWALYIAGSFQASGEPGASFDAADLHDDIKFAEMVASTLGNLRHVRALERSQASLRAFFSPVVLDAIAGQDPDVALTPRKCQVATLFCDLQGFSQATEMADDLLKLLERVSQALGVTTSHILGERGVIGDFHGDAAMGFWGWPLDQPDMSLRACRTALAIERAFSDLRSNAGHHLQDFRIAMGIATGPAVAGKIGTADQVKVTAFGPVVNLAARLEGMTRWLRVPILIDQQTAEEVRRAGTPQMRIRSLAVVQPSGMTAAIRAYQLLPPYGPYSQLKDEHLRIYEQALDRFIAGDWTAAFNLLHQVPAEDEGKDLLTVYIAQHNRVPPPNFTGVIPAPHK